MAASTGLVLTAGALVLTEQILIGPWDATKALKTTVATVLAAYVSAGLDKGLPGFGTGLAVVLVLGVAMKSGPNIANHLLSGSSGLAEGTKK